MIKTTEATTQTAERVSVAVGPVLSSGAMSSAIVEAIRELNENVQVLDRGGYLRVAVAHRCRVTRDAVERASGKAFSLPNDLEAVMPSFVGRMEITENEAVWVVEAAHDAE